MNERYSSVVKYLIIIVTHCNSASFNILDICVSTAHFISNELPSS